VPMCWINIYMWKFAESRLHTFERGVRWSCLLPTSRWVRTSYAGKCTTLGVFYEGFWCIWRKYWVSSTFDQAFECIALLNNSSSMDC
jgi:hypothetical protein